DRMRLERDDAPRRTDADRGERREEAGIRADVDENVAGTERVDQTARDLGLVRNALKVEEPRRMIRDVEIRAHAVDGEAAVAASAGAQTRGQGRGCVVVERGERVPALDGVPGAD